jgi:hypothetical protein
MRFARHLAAIALGVSSMVGAAACGKNVAQSPTTQPAAETPATRQFNAWLSTFNSGDRGALVGYHDKYFPYDVASNDVHGIENEFGLSQGTGGFELKKPETPSATKIIAILKERHSPQFARAEMEVSAAEPHRVTRFEIHPIETPAEFMIVEDDKNLRTAVDATAAGRQFNAWLTAFNAGDRAGLLAYHEQHFPYEVASRDVHGIDNELGLSQGTGGFVLKKPESPAPNSIIAILKEKRSSQFARVEMEVEANEPHRVLRFDIHPIPTPAEFLSPEDRKSREVDAAKRRTVIDGIAKELEAHYIFPEKAKEMVTAIRDHLARGDYDKITQSDDLAVALTKDLRDVSHDLHLGVMFDAAPRGGGPGPTPAAMSAMARSMNYGFGSIRRMEGNIAHLEINGFPPIPDDDAREGVAAVMSKVADADALIVDLRNNGGGSPKTVALFASYLFDATPVHLNDMYSRDTGKIEESWTDRDVRGTRFGGKKPVYVLTSKRTFSGGEEFAYDLQSLRRAKIVGETTGGGAHPVAPHPVDHSFVILVPWGRPINPVTKKDWEGVGVVPDIAVSADTALDEAYQRARKDISGKRGRGGK